MMNKIKAIIYKPAEIELNIESATLLSIEEANRVPTKIRCYGCWWWLRSPGNNSDYAAFVNYVGSIYCYGFYVDGSYGAVRPAFTIPNLKSLNLEIGDKIKIKDKKYIVISDDKILYDDEPIYHRFDEESNDYEKSEIKQFVDEWYEKLNKG